MEFMMGKYLARPCPAQDIIHLLLRWPFRTGPNITDITEYYGILRNFSYGNITEYYGKNDPWLRNFCRCPPGVPDPIFLGAFFGVWRIQRKKREPQRCRQDRIIQKMKSKNQLSFQDFSLLWKYSMILFYFSHRGACLVTVSSQESAWKNEVCMTLWAKAMDSW